MKHFNGGKKALIFLAAAFGFCTPFAQAAFDCSGAAAAIENPGTDPKSLLYIVCPLQSAVWLALYFVGAIVIALILYGGIKALMSTGDARQLEGAKMVWTWAIFGAVIVLFSIFIIQLIFKLLGSNIDPLNISKTIDTAFEAFMNALKNP